MIEQEDIEAYFTVFERVVIWDSKWVARIALYLKGKSLRGYNSLLASEIIDYYYIKKIILYRYHITPYTCRQSLGATPMTNGFVNSGHDWET